MDETVEEDVVEEIKEQVIEQPVKPQVDAIPVNNSQDAQGGRLTFNDVDYISNGNGDVTSVIAPKTIDRLEEISEIRAQQRRMEAEEDDNNNVKLNISDQPVTLDALDIHSIEEPRIELLPDLLIDDIEVLE